MAIRVIDDTKLNDIAVAIQAKDSGGQMTVDEMPVRIRALPTPVASIPALILWDWEGTKLAEYDKDTVLSLNELPAPSTFSPYEGVDHDLLIFQEWNWSLVNIKTWIQAHEGKPLDVGAIYTTTDGQNHNYWGNPRLDTAATINIQKRGTVSIESYAFSDCYSLTQINIPDSVTSIESYAFSDCYSLTQINIPDSVTSIESYAFYDCHSLTQINIPDSVTSIGESAFYNCHSLTQINIPDSVTSIGKGAFYDCYSLTQINIPDSVTSIESYAFYNCYSLCDVLLESKPTLSNTNAFKNLPSIYKIYVPRTDLSWFETETNWATIYTRGNIVAIEDYIEYLESIGFNVDDYKEAA